MDGRWGWRSVCLRSVCLHSLRRPSRFPSSIPKRHSAGDRGLGRIQLETLPDGYYILYQFDLFILLKINQGDANTFCLVIGLK